MQTLGLSESTPRSEGRLKTLFWPSVHTETDLEYVTEQGFWICSIISGLNIWTAARMGLRLVSLFMILEVAFFFLGGIGVRQRSRFAAVAVFAAYFCGRLLQFAMVGPSLVNQVGFQSMGGIVGIVIVALLLANVRGIWQAAKWQPAEGEPPLIRLNETLKDRFTDQMPQLVWPKVRVLFYVLAGIESLMILLAGIGVAIQFNR